MKKLIVLFISITFIITSCNNSKMANDIQPLETNNKIAKSAKSSLTMMLLDEKMKTRSDYDGYLDEVSTTITYQVKDGVSKQAELVFVLDDENKIYSLQMATEMLTDLKIDENHFIKEPIEMNEVMKLGTCLKENREKYQDDNGNIPLKDLEAFRRGRRACWREAFINALESLLTI